MFNRFLFDVNTGLAMNQVRHFTAAFLAAVFLLCSGPVSARVYQTDDAIIVEGNTKFLPLVSSLVCYSNNSGHRTKKSLKPKPISNRKKKAVNCFVSNK